ncbi:hypothetical protein GCM10008935_26160 [Alkalibacillus silvisoli]|uniref:Uncharacterized protein n=1 Tax=Alkalibacillus silvisoli TaxID=392823 RepID=A0ABN1A747_9BACI
MPMKELDIDQLHNLVRSMRTFVFILSAKISLGEARGRVSCFLILPKPMQKYSEKCIEIGQ